MTLLGSPRALHWDMGWGCLGWCAWKSWLPWSLLSWRRGSESHFSPTIWHSRCVELENSFTLEACCSYNKALDLFFNFFCSLAVEEFQNADKYAFWLLHLSLNWQLIIFGLSLSFSKLWIIPSNNHPNIHIITISLHFSTLIPCYYFVEYFLTGSPPSSSSRKF